MRYVHGLWDRLNTEGKPDGAYVRLRVASEPSHRLYAAKRVKDELEAIVYELDVSSLPRDVRWPGGAGFELDREKLGRGRRGEMRIVLRCSARRFADVFRVLAEDVVGHVAESESERAGVVELVAHLHRWQAFLRQHGANGLSESAQTGLFGELWVLSRGLAPSCGMAGAVDAWRGPQRTSHDFQMASGSLEVKTTAAVTPKSVSISNSQQLDDSGVPALYLCVVEVSKAQAARFSLPELVTEIRVGLESPQRETLELMLHRAGYLDIHAERYEQPRYSVRRQRWYTVVAGFPRLLDDDLPSGVSEISYRVALSACTPYECDRGLAVSDLIG